MKTAIQLTDDSIGKIFIRRNYTIVKITERKDDCFVDKFGRWYFSNGTVVTDRESPYDLITELQELPDFNPYRIDEERMIELCNKAKVGYYSSWFSDLIQQYNSNLPEPLKPLPKEMPDEFEKMIKAWARNDIKTLRDVWFRLFKTYGTPSKPELPSVEELEMELSKLWGKDIEMIQRGVATYLHNKYALHNTEPTTKEKLIAKGFTEDEAEALIKEIKS